MTRSSVANQRYQERWRPLIAPDMTANERSQFRRNVLDQATAGALLKVCGSKQTKTETKVSSQESRKLEIRISPGAQVNDQSEASD